MKTLIVGFLTLMICMNSFAGTGEGGGHPLEGQFKNKLKDIMSDILLMSEEARDKLKFNYLSLSALVELEIEPLCATEDQLILLRNLNKKAYVFKSNSREIRIDCSNDPEVLKYWNKKMNSANYVDHIFFIHEALRAQNILNDDNYEFSSSYTDAFKKNIVDQDDKLFRLMHTRNNDCSVVFETDKSSFVNYASLTIKSKKVNSYTIGKNEEIILSKNNFLNGETSLALLARKLIVNKAQDNRCF